MPGSYMSNSGEWLPGWVAGWTRGQPASGTSACQAIPPARLGYTFHPMDTRAELERIRRYLNRQSDLRLAIVYGSLASGRAQPDSDIDIAVAGEGPLDARRKMALIEGLAELTGRSVDLIDLQVVGEPLLGEIITGGVRLAGDDRRYAELLRRHLFDQADFLPYRQRLQAERLEAWIQR